MNRFTLVQLPPHLRAQAEAQINNSAQPQTPAQPKLSPKPKRTVTMSKTEERFKKEFAGLNLLYEPISLKLPGGGRYTPDFASADPQTGHITLYEIKGSYRLHSHGRAHLAFRVAKATYGKLFTFRWFELQKKTFIEKHFTNFTQNNTETERKIGKSDLSTKLFPYC